MLRVSSAPGDGTCGNCHFGGQGGGAITISGTGLTAGFIPGQTYNMEININDDDAAVGGFQLVALDANQQSVGTFIPGTGMQAVNLNNRVYLEHNNSNMFNGNLPNESNWTFQWQAPQSSHSGITFYVSGVAADWLGGFDGDDVYTSSLTLSALAVEFESLEVTSLSLGNVQLNWITAWEANSELFVIERSVDGQLFEAVGSQAAQGTSENAVHYEWVDQVPLLGQAYFYRVKEIDQNGSSMYSQVQEVFISQESAKLLQIYPQPAVLQTEIYFEYFSPAPQDLVYSLHNFEGQQLWQATHALSAGINRLVIPIEGLKRGYYFLALTQEGEKIWKKLVIAN